MTNWYYYAKNGDKVGPITAAALKALARQGLVTPDTILENEQGQSAKAGTVKGLEFPPPSPVPPRVQPGLSQTQAVSNPHATPNTGPIFSFNGVSGRADVYGDRIAITRHGIYASLLPNMVIRYDQMASVKLVKSWWFLRGSLFFVPPDGDVKPGAAHPAAAHMKDSVVFKESQNAAAQKVYDFVDRKLQELHGANYNRLPVDAWTAGHLLIWIVLAVIAGLVGGGLLFQVLDSL